MGSAATRSCLLLGLALLLPAAAAEEESTKPESIHLAVIVNQKNPVTNLKMGALRAHLKLERQYWPNDKRCLLYLPSSKSEEYAILLKKVYRMSHRKLQKYWVTKLFSGQIPAKPSFISDAKAAGARVRAKLGAISIVRSTEVPKGVKVLTIDGKKPGAKDYPLVGIKAKP